ncbi:MAG: replicative DNA helicase [Candidatus Latescibacteria bacterium]|nr:replicative DNA helicase [Candidatus Latescibacterota bacterium]
MEAPGLGGLQEHPRGVQEAVNASSEGAARPARDPRVPPQNLEAEEAILGALLLDRNAIFKAIELLEPDHFYAAKNAAIFTAMVNLFQRGEAVDIITLTEELRREGRLERAGGASYLGGLQESVATGAHIEHYARIVTEKATLRRMIEISGEIVESCFDARDDAMDILDRAESSILAVSQGRLRQGFEPVNEILKATFQNIQRIYDSKTHITGVPTGYERLDRFTGGLQPSDLLIVAGRPSMGKTSLVLNVAQHAAIEEKKSVAFFSLEMSKEQLVQRLLTAEARIDAHKLRTGNLKDTDWPLLTEAAGQLAEAPIYIDDTPAISVLEMRAKCRRLQAQKGLDMVVVDYLQLARATARADNRQQEISEISRGLKALAKELNVPVIALSQLSRALESRTDKRPMLSDLRECVTGDTLVCLADGRRVPIRELVGTTPEVLALDPRRRVHRATSDCVWSVGVKPVYTVSLASGRSIRATGEHRFLGARGWSTLSELRSGDRLAGVPDGRLHEELAIRAESWELVAVGSEASRMSRAGQESMVRLTEATDDLFWDRIVAIEPAGEEEVFDLTVPGPANWLADGIVTHNSGAIEQDADVVMFIYRPEVYDKENEELEGQAELILGKQRNGPTGTVPLFFVKQYTRFENPAHGDDYYGS